MTDLLVEACDGFVVAGHGCPPFPGEVCFDLCLHHSDAGPHQAHVCQPFLHRSRIIESKYYQAWEELDDVVCSCLTTKTCSVQIPDSLSVPVCSHTLAESTAFNLAHENAKMEIASMMDVHELSRHVTNSTGMSDEAR